MFYNWDMDALTKLKFLADNAILEPAEEVTLTPPPHIAPCGIEIGDPKAGANHTSAKSPAATAQQALGIHHAKMPGGKTIPLLKTMLTSACERNCYYCPFRAGRDMRRVTVKPEEMAQSFMDLYRAGVAEGIFLSSGIIQGGVTTQD